jgi:hypothetical protein
MTTLIGLGAKISCALEKLRIAMAGKEQFA